MLTFPLSTLITPACLAFILLGSTISRAQTTPDGTDEASRTARLDFMKQFASTLAVSLATQPDHRLTMRDEPVLRWSNPVRNFFSDGALFVWLDGQRPAALATVSIRGNGTVWLEAASLTEKPLSATLEKKDFWQPRSTAIAPRTLADIEPPSNTPRQRTAQFRRLAERFSAHTAVANQSPSDLRLLAQPIFRYGPDPTGGSEGALFVLTETTDPELLLLLEAVPSADSAPAHWQYALARMTSRPLAVRLDDREVCTADSYRYTPAAKAAPYIERQLAIYPPPAK